MQDCEEKEEVLESLKASVVEVATDESFADESFADRVAKHESVSDGEQVIFLEENIRKNGSPEQDAFSRILTSSVMVKTGIRNGEVPDTEDPISTKESAQRDGDTKKRIVVRAATLAPGFCQKPRSNRSVLGGRNSTWGAADGLQRVSQKCFEANVSKKFLDSQRATRQARKRKQDDMAYEGDMEWEALMGEAEVITDNNGVSEKESFAKSRAKAVVGSLLFAQVQVVTGESAAVAAGLKARAPGPAERIRFKDVLKRRGGLQEYLECRNLILGLWERDVQHILFVTDCGVRAGPIKDENPRASLIREIYEFLNYHGYINMGITSKKINSKGSNLSKPVRGGGRQLERVEDKMTNGEADEEAAIILGQIRVGEETGSHKPEMFSCGNEHQCLAHSPEEAQNADSCSLHGRKRGLEHTVEPVRPAKKVSGQAEVVPMEIDELPGLEKQVDDLSSVEASEDWQQGTSVVDCTGDIPLQGAENESVCKIGINSQEDTENAQRMCQEEVDGTNAVEQEKDSVDERELNEFDSAKLLHNLRRCDSTSENQGDAKAVKLEIPNNLSAPHHEKQKGQKHIIVVGAGPAGLAAASHLQRMDLNVTVLEARKRIGGRVYTDRISFSGPVDLGASIITGVEADVATERRPDPSALLCKQLNLDLTTLRGECPLYDSVTGTKVSAEVDDALETEYNSLLDDTVMLVAQNGDVAMRMSLEEGLESALRERRANQLRNLSSGQIEDVQNRKGGFNLSVSEGHTINQTTSTLFPENSSSLQGKSVKGEQESLSELERRVMDWHFANLEYGCAAELKVVSLPYWNQDDVYGGFGGPHCMIKGGYSTVMEALGNGLDIQLEQVVTCIEYSINEGKNKGEMKKQVKVRTEKGDEFIGDAVLITIPLGCLKANTIQFSPPLPDWKSRSISRLGFGVLNKVVLEFPLAFWDETVDYFGATQERTDQRGQCFMFWNLKRTVGAPILIALVVGKAAIEGEKGESSDLIRHALNILQKLFGEANVPEPTASTVTSWGADPFSRGAYSYVAVGASGEDYDIIGRPVENTLFFAGEATCKEHPDTVGGAMMSGIREAVRITDILENRVDSTAEAEAMAAAQRQSDSERDEVRDMVKRLASAELANAIRKDGCKLDGDQQPLSKAALLQDMFGSAKTTAGRLYLAKELLQLPTSTVKAFAGTKDGLTVLNGWILDSMGKDGTQLLRCCVRLLLLVATDLVSIRQSGVGRTVKEKVFVHTSRDIRAVAGQLVKMWVDVHRKEKTAQGILKPVKQSVNTIKHQNSENVLKVKSKNQNAGKASPSNVVIATVVSKESASLPSISHEGCAVGSPNQQKQMHELSAVQVTVSTEHTNKDVSSVHVEHAEKDLDVRNDEEPMSETEAAALAAVKAAQAAALAAAKAYATAEASRSVQPELPKILSFHKFAQREHVAIKELSKKRSLETENFVLHGKQHTSSGVEARTCKVRNWSIDFSGSCSYLACSDDGANSRDGSALAVPDSVSSLPNICTGKMGEDAVATHLSESEMQGTDMGSTGIRSKDVTEDLDSAMSIINTLLRKGNTSVGTKSLDRQPSNGEQKVNVPATSAQVLSEATQGNSLFPGSGKQSTRSMEGCAESSRRPEQIKKAVCDYIALLLTPLYKTRKIQKDGFKSIVKKATVKVMERNSDQEAAMSVSEFLDTKRKNKIRSLVDKFVERYLEGTRQ